MDKLDKISACAISVFLAWALVLVVFQISNNDGTASGKQGKKAEVRRYIDPNYDKQVALAKNLLAGGSAQKADLLIDEIIKGYPFEGVPFMLKGDVYLRKQEPIAAMLEYKKAVDLNPDFLDKKAELFQGKKIKKTVEEAFDTIEAGLAENPDNQELKENKKTLYYMLRKIAGSCG